MANRPERRARIVAAMGSTLATARVAETPLSRMIGLLGRASLEPGDGLVLRPCSMIHTCFMRFPIDVLFVDAEGMVVRAVDALGPFRVAWGGWRTAATIELPAGTLRSAGVAFGGRIRIEPT